MTEQKRKFRIGLGSFDFIKGFGIIITVLFHASVKYSKDGSPFFYALNLLLSIGLAAMPMYFFISGYGFKPTSTRSMLKKTFSDLIVPYLLIAAAHAVIVPISYYLPWKNIKDALLMAVRYIAAFLLGNPEEGKEVFGFALMWNSAAWFFLALFINMNLLNWILRIRNIYLQIGCVLLSLVGDACLTSIDMPLFSIAKALRYFPYLYFGYLLKKHNLLSRLVTCPWIYLLLVPLWLVDAEQLPFAERLGLFGGIPACGIYMAQALLIVLLGLWANRINLMPFEWIKQIGMYTYWIIAIHSVELTAIPWGIMAEKFSSHPELGYCIEIALKFVLITSFCMLFKHLTKRKYRRTKLHA